LYTATEKRALGNVLADHVLVEDGLNLGRHRQIERDALEAPVSAGTIIADDVVAQLDALIADEDRRPGDEFSSPRAGSCRRKRAVQKTFSAGGASSGHGDDYARSPSEGPPP